MRRLKIDKKPKKDTLITSKYLRYAKFTTRRIPKCDVEKFEREKEMLTEHWIFQMETYFLTSQIPVDRMVSIIVQKVAPKQFD